MKNPLPFIAIGLLVVLLLASSENGASPFSPQTCRPGRVPHNLLIEVPEEYRQRNYGSSCVWSSTISMLRAIGDHKSADWLRRNRGGGAGPGSLNAALSQIGVPYAFTTDGDERLIEWALKHNYPVGIGYGSHHAQLLMGRKDGQAVILNNFSNDTEVHTVPWSTFIQRWKNCPPVRGWAWVCVPKGIVPPPEVPLY